MIYLIGMMGSGKSQLGKAAADILKLPFYETDSMAEELMGMTIPEIFQAYGEERFRDIESQVLKEVSKLPFGIVSTGGGAVLRAQNRALMKQTGKVLWLHRDIIETAATIDTRGRPLLKEGNEAVIRIYGERLHLYREADAEFKGNTPNELADAIAKLM